MIEETFTMLLVVGTMLAMLLMSVATRIGECSLLGYTIMGLGMPLSFEGYLGGGSFGLKIIGTPMLLLGLAFIASDWFENYEWIQIILGIPPEKRWRKNNGEGNHIQKQNHRLDRRTHGA